jgi:hypothetical protein
VSNETDPTLQALDRIEAKLPVVDAGVVAPAAFNALSVDQLVHLQETDPDRYQRSLQAASSTPDPEPRYAEAPADVVPAGQFNALTPSQLSDLATKAPELYQRTIEHWSTHEQTEEAA